MMFPAYFWIFLWGVAILVLIAVIGSLIGCAAPPNYWAGVSQIVGDSPK